LFLKIGRLTETVINFGSAFRFGLENMATKNEIMLSGFTGPRTLAVGIGGPKVEAQPVYKSLSANWSGFFYPWQAKRKWRCSGPGFFDGNKGFDGFAENAAVSTVTQK
jgi:hypothetical protein